MEKLRGRFIDEWVGIRKLNTIDTTTRYYQKEVKVKNWVGMCTSHMICYIHIPVSTLQLLWKVVPHHL